MKKITRTIIKTYATVVMFSDKDRKNETVTYEFNDKYTADEVMNILYNKHKKGSYMIPLYVEDLKTIEYLYSMPVDKFIENADIENVNE